MVTTNRIEAPMALPGLINLIIGYETGALDADATLRLFSHLVRTGLAWHLQGHYGRMATELITLGYLTPEGAILSTTN